MLTRRVYLSIEQKLQQETTQWQKRVDTLNQMADRLITEYNSDDTSKVKDTVALMNTRWQQFKARLVILVSII